MPKLYTGQPQLLSHNLVTAAGASLTSAAAATASFYIRCDSGVNAGKWYRGSDTSWQAARSIAGAGTYVSGSQWTISLPAATLAVGTYTVTAEHSLGTQFAYDRTWQVEVLPGGAGAYTLTVTVTAAGLPVDGFDVWVTTDAAGNNVIAGKKQTDDAGEVTFTLDAIAVKVWAQLAGYNVTNPTSKTISATVANTVAIAATAATADVTADSTQLCTLDQVKRVLGLTDSDTEHDDVLTQIMQQVAAAMEGVDGAQRRLTQHTGDRHFNVYDATDRLLCPSWPVVSYGDVEESYANDWANASLLVVDEDFYVDADRGVFYRIGQWLPGNRSVRISDLASGYVSPVTSSAGGFVLATGQVLMPADIVGAAVKQTIHEFNRRKDPALGSQSAGGASVAAVSAVVPGELLAGVAAVCKRYRRRSV